jgi:hypothetical protein
VTIPNRAHLNYLQCEPGRVTKDSNKPRRDSGLLYFCKPSAVSFLRAPVLPSRLTLDLLACCGPSCTRGEGRFSFSARFILFNDGPLLAGLSFRPLPCGLDLEAVNPAASFQSILRDAAAWLNRFRYCSFTKPLLTELLRKR